MVLVEAIQEKSCVNFEIDANHIAYNALIACGLKR